MDDDDFVGTWYLDYARDFFADSEEYNDWHRRFKKDFMVDRSGRFRFSEAVERQLGNIARRRRGQTLFRDLRLVGRGERTREGCGEFLKRWYGCIRHDPIWAKPIFNFCNRPSCPKCYLWGWCADLTYDVSLRLASAEVKYGLPAEHLMVSLPDSKYGITLAKCKVEVLKLVYGFDVFAGYIIPHANRVDRDTFVERFSPHLHLLAFFDGGLERCRKCQFNPDFLGDWVGECMACDGVFSRIRHANEGATRDSGRYLTKVFGERESVPKTVFYQLSHSSYDPNRPKARVGVYFGKLGYNKIGLKVEKPKRVCGFCGGDCGAVEHVGKKDIYILPRWFEGFESQFYQALTEDGEVAWRVQENQERDFWKERDEYGG